MLNSLFDDYEIHDIDSDVITLLNVTLIININKNLLNGDFFEMVTVQINTGNIDFFRGNPDDIMTSCGTYRFKLQEIV